MQKNKNKNKTSRPNALNNSSIQKQEKVGFADGLQGVVRTGSGIINSSDLF